MEENKMIVDEEMLQEALQQYEEEIAEDGIPFCENIIYSHEQVSNPNAEEYDKGVKEASVYIGQFHALINAGMSSDYAITVMSWIREDKLNKDAIDMQLEVAKQESFKVKREIL